MNSLSAQFLTMYLSIYWQTSYNFKMSTIILLKMSVNSESITFNLSNGLHFSK